VEIGFEVCGIPEGVYKRYVRYNYWWRRPVAAALYGVTLGVLISLTVASIVSEKFDVFAPSIFSMPAVWLLVWPTQVWQQRQKQLGTHTGYVFREEDFNARTHEVFQAWKYGALDYAREAKDAFYLVRNAQAGEAMVIPKQALTPEQCAALAGLLQGALPGKKFTSWKGASQ
jgi:hypothetical protein